MNHLFDGIAIYIMLTAKRLFKYRIFDIQSLGYEITMKSSINRNDRYMPNHANHLIQLITFFVLTLIPFMNIRAQTIFSIEYSSRADIKVYVVEYESQADLLVYKVSYESQAGRNDGKWFFTQYESQASKKVYFVEYESQADLKIFFVKYESQAGWRKKEKQHLMY